MNNTLKIIREKRGFTQVQIADKALISEISYQRIEYGTQNPSLKTAQLIAKALNSTVEELFPLSGTQKINQLNDITRKEK